MEAGWALLLFTRALSWGCCDRIWALQRTGRMAQRGCSPRSTPQVGEHCGAGLPEAVTSTLGVIFSILLMGKPRLRGAAPAQGCAGDRGQGRGHSPGCSIMHLPPPSPRAEDELAAGLQLSGQRSHGFHHGESLAWCRCRVEAHGVNVVQKRERHCPQSPGLPGRG